MLKLKTKYTEYIPRPVERMEGPEPKEGEKDTRVTVYGEPFGPTILLKGLKTPDLIRLQAVIDSAGKALQGEAVYNEFAEILGKSVGGWDGLPKETFEKIAGAELEEIPENHVLNGSSARMEPTTREQIIDTLMMLSEQNVSFYGALSSGIIEQSMQKKSNSKQS